uniref:Core shell protein Gag P30 domain-containing protein n=1 Tax=Podarcis muralis TaxID=64176 RepID=A0A670J9Q7_PODMU
RGQEVVLLSIPIPAAPVGLRTTCIVSPLPKARGIFDPEFYPGITRSGTARRGRSVGPLFLRTPKGTTSYQLPILNPGRQPMPPPYEDDDVQQTLVPFYYQGPPPRAPTPSDSNSSIKHPGQAKTKIPSSTLHNTIEDSTQIGNKPAPTEPYGSATGTLGCDKETPGTSDQVSSTVSSTAVQMPLRALPIPPLVPDGPPRMVYTHQPFYTSDLVTWSNQMPSLRDDPDKCHRQVSAIFSTHNPTWPDVHVLLNALFNEAEKADILTKAGEAIELPDYQRGRPQGLQALTAQCLRVEPAWDYNTTNGIWCLNLFKRAILDGVKAAGQRTVNWTKVQSVMQGPNEHPSDYYTRLVSAIKTWGGIDPENPQHEVIVKGFFKDQACPDIRKALNLQIGYDGKSVSEILSIAKSVYNSRDERKKKETKPEVEQILALSMETIDGHPYQCLLDIGATYSTLTDSHLEPGTVTKKVMGLDGIPRTCPLSRPAKVTLGPLLVEHTFLLTSSP